MPPKRNQNRPKSKTQNKSVVNPMGECVLPQDIIVSIFARLPVKSLARFKCVCKPFNDLVTNPNFIKLHSRHFPQTPKTSKTFSVQSHVLKCPILGIDPPKKLALVNPSNPYEIYLDACNGLICMGRPYFSKDIVLWNPATNMWKTLPLSTVDFGAAAMATLGFGVNADGDDFKVVRIFILKGKKMRVGVEVYSSKTDSWRKIDIDVGFKFTVLAPKNHVIVRGNPYWVVACLDEKRIAEGQDSRLLLGFDSTNMTFKTVPLPKFDEMGGDSGLPFVDWEGSVGVLVCFKRENGLLERIDVWVYDEGVSKWRRERRFGPIDVDADQCLDCSKSGKIVGGCTDRKLFMFDPKKDSAGVVSELKKRKGCSFQIFGYDESLAYIKGMTPVIVKKEDQKEKYKDIDGFFVSSLHHGSGEITCYYALAM